MGAIGSHQSASAQADAANAAARSNYKYQLKVRERAWDRTRHVYSRQLMDTEKQIDQNELASQRAYAGEQRRLNDAYKSMSFKNQSRLMKLLSEQGKYAARGRTGKSSQRAANAANRMAGMSMAADQETLMGATTSFKNRNDSIRNQLLSANNQAYSRVATAPQPDVAPPPPVMQSGPSGLGLASNLIGAGISGYNAGMELKNYQAKLPGE
jgi:ribosomal protein S18